MTRRRRVRIQPPTPRWTLQTRLVVAFTLLVALALFVVGISAATQLEGHFREQERVDLDTRAAAALAVVVDRIEVATTQAPILDPSGEPSAAVERALGAERPFLTTVADLIAEGDVTVTLERVGSDGTVTPGGSFSAVHTPRVSEGQSRQLLDVEASVLLLDAWHTRPDRQQVRATVTISEPFTFRDRSIQTVRGLLMLVGSLMLAFAGLTSLWLVRRLTRPMIRLTQAARAMAEGDLRQQVPIDQNEPRELVELSEQFNAMAERLEQSMRLMREDRDRGRDLLADVSHELRTPIAALRTYNELLRDGADLDATARREFLDSSAEQIERLDWLATNLLELSKLDAGLVALDLRPSDLRAVAESAAEAAERTAAGRGVELRVELPGSPVRTRHDQQRIGQLLSNLLSNGVKFTPPGGSVTLTVARTGGGAVLRVADTGLGIDAAELPHIFERFFRGNRAAEARAAGSGLGLAIAKSIVDMHHGVITVDSSPDRGTTVEVRLPRDPEAGTVAETSPTGGRT